MINNNNYSNNINQVLINDLSTVRQKHIESYLKSCAPTDEAFNLLQQNVDINKKDIIEQDFENSYLLKLEFPYFDNKDSLIETYIRYALTYLDDIDYNKKINGLRLFNHLFSQITPMQLNLNMRSTLIYDSFNKYLNDKECVEFFAGILSSMRILLNIIESKYACREHAYSKHSNVLDSLLNNCYMSSNNNVKVIYLKSIKDYLEQIGMYSVRHLEKIFTVAFDYNETLISGKHQDQRDLLDVSLDLIEFIIELCSLRMHKHTKRIMNNLLKFIYSYSLNVEADLSINSNKQTDETDIFIKRIITLFKSLLHNEKNSNYYDEFCLLRKNNKEGLNNVFLKLIEDI